MIIVAIFCVFILFGALAILPILSEGCEESLANAGQSTKHWDTISDLNALKAYALEVASKQATPELLQVYRKGICIHQYVYPLHTCDLGEIIANFQRGDVIRIRPAQLMLRPRAHACK